MLLNCSTASTDSTTHIEKTSRKGASEREQPNRSVVKMFYTLSTTVTGQVGKYTIWFT